MTVGDWVEYSCHSKFCKESHPNPDIGKIIKIQGDMMMVAWWSDKRTTVEQIPGSFTIKRVEVKMTEDGPILTGGGFVVR